MLTHTRIYPTKNNFLRHFTNKELENAAPYLYEFLRKAWTEKRFNQEEIGKELLTLYRYTEELQGLARLYEDTCNPRKIPKRYKVSREGSLIELQKGVQNAILSCLDSLYRCIDKHTLLEPLEPDNQKNFDLWNNYLKSMPYPEEIRENANGHLLTDDVMAELMAFIKRAPKDMIGSITITADDVVKSFLRYAKGLGIPMNSEVYRELYDCLDIFALISEEQYQAHEKTPSMYVRESYIKMKIKRLQ